MFHLAWPLLDINPTWHFQTLRHFVTDYKVHPILVNFTAALIPISVISDILSRVFRRESLRAAGWWTMLYAAIITPFTAVAGWLFWMSDDVTGQTNTVFGIGNMTIHKWLGTALAVLLVALMIWRIWIFKRNHKPSWLYLLVGVLVIVALTYQGHLGGLQALG